MLQSEIKSNLNAKPRLTVGVLLYKENGIILTFNNYRGTSIVALIGKRYMHIYNAELFRQF